MRLRRTLFAASLCLSLAGCRSAFVDAVVRNRTDRPISLIEVDYPSASFGTQTLMPNQDYHYRFKIQGSGDLTFLYTDADHLNLVSTGPKVDDGTEGSLAIAVTPQGVEWTPKLINRKEKK
jgi:hypothetical protein